MVFSIPMLSHKETMCAPVYTYQTSSNILNIVEKVNKTA